MGTAKRQFDLLLLLEWMAAIAFLAALLAGSAFEAWWTTEFFATLPADDSALETWLDEQGHDSIRVWRDGSSITLQKRNRFVPIDSLSELPKPPWQALGYPALKGMRGGAHWRLFSGSPYLWIVGFGLLIGLRFYRSRQAARRKLNKDFCGEEQEPPHRD
jgi:hypothetical protein